MHREYVIWFGIGRGVSKWALRATGHWQHVKGNRVSCSLGDAFQIRHVTLSDSTTWTCRLGVLFYTLFVVQLYLYVYNIYTEHIYNVSGTICTYRAFNKPFALKARIGEAILMQTKSGPLGRLAQWTPHRIYNAFERALFVSLRGAIWSQLRIRVLGMLCTR